MALSRETYRKIYNILSDVTPLEYDCGLLCGKACCQGTRDLGIYLFPGEEEVYDGREEWLRWKTHKVRFYNFPPSWTGTVKFVACIEACPREKRPLQCRFYPLTAHLLKDGTLLIIKDPVQVPYRCPIIDKKLPISREFVDRVYRAWRILLADEKIRELVLWDSLARENDPGFVPDILLAEEEPCL